MKTIVLFLCIISSVMVQSQSLPNLSSGSIRQIENFKSEFIASHHVDVWLPDGYDQTKKYSVVYMHDGQMLFDSTQTWNKKEWKVDETFSQLIRDRKIVKCIVVAIWNNGADRISEYLPNGIFSRLDEKTQAMIKEKYGNGKPAGGNDYLKFLVTELKPFIDQNYSTWSDKDHTFMIGSSMGALISIAAICEYPEIFGGVACLSTAWLSQIEPNYEIPLAAFDYFKQNLPSPFGHKIYFDYGTGESDKTYEMTQSFVDLIAKGKGFNEWNYLSKVYEKDQHEEIAWSKRLHFPIEFLLGKIPDQKASSGKIDKYDDFESKFVTARNVEVWLPDGYSPARKYAVLYMHDGQNLYDSTTTWNRQSWDVDDVLSKLLKENKIQDMIVVGVWNGGATRHPDYFPQKPFESLSPEQQEFVSNQLRNPGTNLKPFQPNSDNYLKFLVTELKPFIDKKYSVYKDQKHTFVAGSSMGGLISMYTICEYPKVFGGAACLSTHWAGIFSVENNPVPDAFAEYMHQHLPNPRNHKLYFDYGDQTLDAMYPPLQKKVDEVMKEAGYTEENWETKFFPGKDHSEKSWKARFEIPAVFLLKK